MICFFKTSGSCIPLCALMNSRSSSSILGSKKYRFGDIHIGNEIHLVQALIKRGLGRRISHETVGHGGWSWSCDCRYLRVSYFDDEVGFASDKSEAESRLSVQRSSGKAGDGLNLSACRPSTQIPKLVSREAPMNCTTSDLFMLIETAR